MQVIEDQLLARLSDKQTVAILASKEDLDALLFVLDTFLYERRHDSEEDGIKGRIKELQEGFRLLRRSAFEKNTTPTTPT